MRLLTDGKVMVMIKKNVQIVLKIIDMNNNMEEIAYEDTEVYKIYKDFLNNPYGKQKILFD